MATRLNTSPYHVSAIVLLLVSCAGGSDAVYQSQASEGVEQTHATSNTDGAQASPLSLRVLERTPQVDLEPARADASAHIASAVDDAGQRVLGWWTSLPQQPGYRELLDPEREFDHSLSMGTVGKGELINAASLPAVGDHYAVIDRHRSRNTHFGSEVLIEAIVDAADSVAKTYPGSSLRVGNMSRRSGGDIPWSSSHNSGRDADLAFYCKRKSDGKPVPAPDLLAFDATGQAIERPDLIFDVERNWQLAKALLTHERAQIQWLFISQPLKDMLLDHARELGEPDELIEKASKVLHQPTDALPHNDHFHLRITCPRADRLEGCLDFGPRWEWVDWHHDHLLARSLELGRALREAEAKTRLRALDMLERIRSPYAPELALDAALGEQDQAVRLRALEVASSVPLWSEVAARKALRLTEREGLSGEEKAHAYSVLRRSADPIAREPLTERIADRSLDVAERALAARALGHQMDAALVPFLIEQLGEQPAQVAEPLAVALRRVTNRSEDIDWTSATDAARAEALGHWQTWWKERRDYERDDWLEEGFVAHGFDAERLFDMRAVDDLIPMLQSGPDHLAYNANLVLQRITGRWAPLEAWSHQRLYRYWTRWWQRNRPRMVATR
jgi:murein endopeptidase